MTAPEHERIFKKIPPNHGDDHRIYQISQTQIMVVFKDDGGYAVYDLEQFEE